MKFDVLNRWSGQIQFTAEIECAADASTRVKMGLALKLAYSSGAVLRDADLRGAVLRGAVLRDADLRDADLSGADLSGAVLRDAVLRGADLSGADLRGAVLRGADLRGAVLRGAVLRDADLRDADLSDADLSGADLSGALIDAPPPKIEKIDAKILAAIEGGGKLYMGDWHKCETTHCRAGWAITLAGDAGAALEAKIGPAAAGALIYAMSRPEKPIPNFYATNEAALADIKACAAEQLAAP
jgi:hypothetical protein